MELTVRTENGVKTFENLRQDQINAIITLLSDIINDHPRLFVPRILVSAIDDAPEKPVIADDPLVCSECGHRRLNPIQADACCSWQGDDCPECAKTPIVTGPGGVVLSRRLASDTPTEN